MRQQGIKQLLPIVFFKWCDVCVQHEKTLQVQFDREGIDKHRGAEHPHSLPFA
jgi:hypothetical protein